MDTSTESQEGYADQAEDEGEHIQHINSKKGIDTCNRFGPHFPQYLHFIFTQKDTLNDSTTGEFCLSSLACVVSSDPRKTCSSQTLIPSRPLT